MEDSINELWLGPIRLTVRKVSGATDAPEYLKHNGCNRPYRLRTGEQYARDMTNDVWLEKPIPICFDENGNLINGQHTLNALMLSGKSYYFLIAEHVPADVVSILDRGLTRSDADTGHFYQMTALPWMYKVAKALEFGLSDRKIRSWDEKRRAVLKHAEVLNWLAANHKRRPWIKPTTLVGVARAYYSRNRERLADFLNVMQTGLNNGEPDTAAILLREFCKNARKVQTRRLGTEPLDKRTATALSYFLEHRPLQILRATGPSCAELFPLPGEVTMLSPEEPATEVTMLSPAESPVEGDQPSL